MPLHRHSTGMWLQPRPSHIAGGRDRESHRRDGQPLLTISAFEFLLSQQADGCGSHLLFRARCAFFRTVGGCRCWGARGSRCGTVSGSYACTYRVKSEGRAVGTLGNGQRSDRRRLRGHHLGFILAGVIFSLQQSGSHRPQRLRGLFRRSLFSSCNRRPRRWSRLAGRLRNGFEHSSFRWFQAGRRFLFNVQHRGRRNRNH